MYEQASHQQIKKIYQIQGVQASSKGLRIILSIGTSFNPTVFYSSQHQGVLPPEWNIFWPCVWYEVFSTSHNVRRFCKLNVLYCVMEGVLNIHGGQNWRN